MGQASNVLRWPLWSWRNLSVTAVAVLLVFYGMGRVVEPAKVSPSKARVPLVTASPVYSQPSELPAAASAQVAVPVPTSTSGPSADSGADEDDAVTTLAIVFARAWSSSGRSPQEWKRGIQPYVTPALAAGLARTDPGRVPATKVTGEAALLKASATSAQVKVPTNGGSIVVTLRRSLSAPWQVSDVAPAGQPPSSPAPDLHPRTSPARS